MAIGRFNLPKEMAPSNIKGGKKAGKKKKKKVTK